MRDTHTKEGVRKSEGEERSAEMTLHKVACQIMRLCSSRKKAIILKTAHSTTPNDIATSPLINWQCNHTRMHTHQRDRERERERERERDRENKKMILAYICLSLVILFSTHKSCPQPCTTRLTTPSLSPSYTFCIPLSLSHKPVII